MTDMDTTNRPAPGRKTVRENPREKQTLAEPVVIAEWKRNRHGETIRCSIQTFNEYNLFDLRTWWSDNGYRKPGKGFCCAVAHLPELARAVNAALAKAIDLDLIELGPE